jgi:hypothetical protein
VVGDGNGRVGRLPEMKSGGIRKVSTEPRRRCSRCRQSDTIPYDRRALRRRHVLLPRRTERVSLPAAAFARSSNAGIRNAHQVHRPNNPHSMVQATVEGAARARLRSGVACVARRWRSCEADRGRATHAQDHAWRSPIADRAAAPTLRGPKRSGKTRCAGTAPTRGMITKVQHLIQVEG